MLASRRCLRFQDILPRTTANYAPLTPLQWLDRAATTFPNHEAVCHRPTSDATGNTVVSRNWLETRNRAVSFASTLANDLKCGRNECVQVMLRNTPEMVEAHFAVPMAGSVLGCVNTRLDASSVSYILGHSEAKVFVYDTIFSKVVKDAVDMLPSSAKRPVLVEVGNDGNENELNDGGDTAYAYESLVSGGDSSFAWRPPKDEFDAIALNYTSGTTGLPKGCVVHHRGAYLAALGDIMAFGGMASERATRYLWTLPMFHCNGWNFPYAVAALGGTNICLDNVDVPSIKRGVDQDGATHLCGAPIVMGMTIEACAELKKKHKLSRELKMMVAAAPPPAAVLRQAAEVGLSVTHVYGLTEVYGPATVCEWQGQWDGLDDEEKANLLSRQGVPYVTLEELTVLNQETGEQVPADGETIGEVVMRGNQVFKGYHKNEEATNEAFKDGYFHTGDLGVICEDGYIALKDRAKDIIISGGENISSIEVENVLYKHESVTAAAVVGMPHEKWQEVGCAFVETSHDIGDEEEFESELISWCKERMPRFKAPHRVVVGELPKTITGKVQKFELRKKAQKL